jgi:hypothetical protein
LLYEPDTRNEARRTNKGEMRICTMRNEGQRLGVDGRAEAGADAGSQGRSEIFQPRLAIWGIVSQSGSSNELTFTFTFDFIDPNFNDFFRLELILYLVV